MRSGIVANYGLALVHDYDFEHAMPVLRFILLSVEGADQDVCVTF